MEYVVFNFALNNTSICNSQPLTDTVIYRPQYQSLTINHYVDEPISLSYGATLNILPGASVEIGQLGSNHGYINVLGGKIRNRLYSAHFAENYTLNMMGGHIEGLDASHSTDYCTVIVSGGSAGLFTSSCNTYISGGKFNGFVGPEWGGSINISGGVFNEYLISRDGSYEISGGKFNNPLIHFTTGGTMDFFGYDLTITDPYNYTGFSYERQIAGHLLDGRYISMNVLVQDVVGQPIAEPDISAIRVHNTDGDYSHITVPEPSTLILLGAGIIGISATRLRKTK